MNLNWCFPELNFYAQCRRFSLAFREELREYYDNSIEHQCDGDREYNTVRRIYEKQDAPYGPPDDCDLPTQTLIDWCRWAHVKSVNKGYAPSQSREHLIDGLDYGEMRLRGSPLEGTLRREEPEIPPGLFPWRWPQPDGPNAYDTYKDTLDASLIMEDVDVGCQIENEELYKYTKGRDVKPVAKTSVAASAPAAASTAIARATANVIEVESIEEVNLLDLTTEPTTYKVVEPTPVVTHVPAALPKPVPVAKSPPATIDQFLAVMKIPPALPLIPTAVFSQLRSLQLQPRFVTQIVRPQRKPMRRLLWQRAKIHMQKEIDRLESYKPVMYEILDQDKPVELMAKASPDSTDNRYMPVMWNSELVQPPYETFYQDGARYPPKLDKLT
eukprot:5938531-Amphidinium_carterae.1